MARCAKYLLPWRRIPDTRAWRKRCLLPSKPDSLVEPAAWRRLMGLRSSESSQHWNDHCRKRERKRRRSETNTRDDSIETSLSARIEPRLFQSTHFIASSTNNAASSTTGTQYAKAQRWVGLLQFRVPDDDL